MTAEQSTVVEALKSAGILVELAAGEYDQKAAADVRFNQNRLSIGLTMDSTDQVASGADVVERICFETGTARVVLFHEVMQKMIDITKSTRTIENDRFRLLEFITLCAGASLCDYNQPARMPGITFEYMVQAMMDMDSIIQHKNRSAYEVRCIICFYFAWHSVYFIITLNSQLGCTFFLYIFKLIAIKCIHFSTFNFYADIQNGF